MLNYILIALAGVKVGRRVYHPHCAPDGASSPLFTTDDAVDEQVCHKCKTPLIAPYAEPELEEIDADVCRFCGGAVTDTQLALGIDFCSDACESLYFQEVLA